MRYAAPRCCTAPDRAPGAPRGQIDSLQGGAATRMCEDEGSRRGRAHRSRASRSAAATRQHHASSRRLHRSCAARHASPQSRTGSRATRARADRGGRAGLRPLGRHHHPTQISRTAPLARRGEQEDPPARDRCAPLLGAACGIGAEQRGCRKRESSGRAASARRCALVRGREAASTLTPRPPTHHPPPPLRGVN